MDIYEFAMKMEKDGEQFYRDLAGKCGSKGLATILTMLADAEVKHYNLFQRMRENTDPILTDTLLLDNVKNVFEKMSEQRGEKGLDLDASQTALYREAQDVEKRSEEFYLEKAREVKSIPHRKIFTAIAKEEHQHYKLLGHLIEFVKTPERWLEDAEWSNIGKEY